MHVAIEIANGKKRPRIPKKFVAEFFLDETGDKACFGALLSSMPRGQYWLWSREAGESKFRLRALMIIDGPAGKPGTVILCKQGLPTMTAKEVSPPGSSKVPFINSCRWN